MHQPVSTAERSFLVVIFTAERSPFQTLVSLGVASRIRTGGDFDGIGAVGVLLRPLVLSAGHRRERRLPRGSAIARLSRRDESAPVECGHELIRSGKSQDDRAAAGVDRGLVVTAARLLILGVLRAEQPAYGYEIRRELESWGAERWASVAPGSIYHALNTMAQEGFVERVETGESSKGPARNTYVITERGEREFQRLLREFLWQKKPTIDPLQAALAFLNAVPKDELAAALEHRAASARANAQALQFANESLGQNLPPHFVESHLLGALHAEAEAQWAEEALKKVERDELP